MRTNWIKSAMLAICVMMALPTVSLAKDNKEKKPFQWTWDKKLSGEKNVDEYLLSVDSCRIGCIVCIVKTDSNLS